MTNEVAFYKFGEICLLDTNSDQVFVILRSKFYTNLNGDSGWSFMLRDEDDQVYKEGGEQWFPSQRLKKLHVPSDFSFEGLMVILKDVVERRDFE